MTKAFRDKIIAKAEELGWNCTASDWRGLWRLSV